MEINWRARERQTEMTVINHEDGTRTVVEMDHVGDATTVSVADTVVRDGTLDTFRFVNFFVSDDEAREWVENIAVPKLNGLFTSGGSFPPAPRPDPVVDWHWSEGLGMYKDADGRDDIAFYIHTIASWGSTAGFKIAGYDTEDGFYASMLVRTREDAEKWAVDFVKKFRP